MKKTIVREYQLPSSCIKGKQELTIAFLTDLHDQVTGEDGERIFHLLKEQEPDLVLVGGDVIVGKKGCDTSKAFGLRIIRYFMPVGIMNNVFQSIRRFTGRSGKTMRQR